MSRLRCAALVAVLVGIGTPAAAWPLRYAAPDGSCVDAARFRGQVEDQRGSPDTDVDVAVGLDAAPTADRWTVAMTIFVGADAGARRDLTASSCDEALAAAALILALALDAAPPLPLLELAVPALAPPAAPAAPVVLPPRRALPPASRPARPTEVAVAVGAGLAPGGLPGTPLGAHAELQLRYGPVELGLGGGAIQRSEQVDANGVGAEASMWFTAIALRATPWRRFTLGTSFEIGKLSAQGVGVALPRQESLQWQAIGGSLRVAGPRWRGLQPAVTVEVAVPLANLALQVNGSTRFETGPILRVWIGAALPFL